MKSMTGWLAAVVVIALMTTVAAGELSFKRGQKDTRPEIFKKAKPAAVLMAEEIARQDAWGKIAEMIAGMEVKGGVSIRDLSSGVMQFATNVKSQIKGMKETDIKYYDEGIVQIKVEVVWRELVEQVEVYVKKNGGQVDADSFVKYNSYPSDRVIAVWGSGPLPGSEGVEIVKALRAAEVAASAQMLAKVEGVEVTRESTVRDFALASDEIRSCLQDSIKNVNYVDYRILDDTVEVDAEIELSRTIERFTRTLQHVVRIDRCTGCPKLVPEYQNVRTLEQVPEIYSATGKAVISGMEYASADIAEEEDSEIAYDDSDAEDEGDYELEGTYEKRTAQGLVVKP